ncbi:DUF6090 family protein [uncultured Croceitalea sp.]|uniref:DUF6090 family protein n=1 Tax=uncultured Croceitalea sp. TaxID=1798908 RepID=UPI0033061123
MIKFFRKIRENLLSEGKTGKYLKYAIGEIILVVIGILIALQINNWNEKRKNQNYERKILTLINQNLENDSIALSNQLYSLKSSKDLTDKLLEQVSLGNYNDSLNYWLGEIISFERFKSQSSAFEMLKSKGIDIISNDELQLALITYYDEHVLNVYAAHKDVEESFKDDWIPIMKEDFSEFEWKTYASPRDSKSFFENPANLSFFKFFKTNKSSSEPYLEAALQKLSEINKLSKNHLSD